MTGEEKTQRGTSWPAWVTPLGIVLLGLALRLYRLDSQSLWYDELFSVAFSRMPWAELHASLVEDIVHPPFHYALLHVWSSLFGAGPVQARLLSVIFGTASILALYQLAKYLFDQKTATISALLLTVSQHAIQYSQEARAYSLILLLVLGASFLFLRTLRDRRPLDWWLFVVVIAVLATTHYYGVFAATAFVIFALIYRKRYSIPATWYLSGAVVVSAVVGVWMASGVLREFLASPKTAPGHASDHWFIFTVVNEFNNGRDAFPESAPWWAFVAGGVLFVGPMLLALREGTFPHGQRNRENTVFLSVLFAVPILLAFATGRLFNLQAVRYVGFCIAPYYILVARGIGTLKSSALRSAVVCALLLYSAYALRANYFIPYKEDHRSALNYVAQHSRAGDCSVTTPAEVRQVGWSWSIYEPAATPPPPTTLESVLSDNACERVWLISVTKRNPIKLQWAEQAKRRMERAYSRTDWQSFFWIDVGLYERRKVGRS